MYSGTGIISNDTILGMFGLLSNQSDVRRIGLSSNISCNQCFEVRELRANAAYPSGENQTVPNTALQAYDPRNQ